tara:strand:+ start:1959 stop:3437 length:1479 start_codon:yes stop_codon:yes gene_type:complete
MAGGLIQLVSQGTQDVYITGNPQITFFKVVYRRHTNFSIESIIQNINGSNNIEVTKSEGDVVVSRNGDLLSKVYVVCAQTTNGIKGDQVVDDVELIIGGTLIDKQTKEWNQVITELKTPVSKAEGFQYMTGGYNNTSYKLDNNQAVVQIPLNFWFCHNIGLALPLISLQYHEIKLKFIWGQLSDISRLSSDTTTIPCEVWCDYIFLDKDERKRFAQVSHEYLIEQIQKTTYQETERSYKLNFNHPVKELIWTENTFTDEKIKIQFNGIDRISEQSKEYFQLRQPSEYHTSIPGYNIKESENPVMLNEPIKISTGAAKGAGSTVDDETNPIAIDIDGATDKHISIYSTSITPKVGDVLSVFHSRTSGSTVSSVANYIVNVKEISSSNNVHEITLNENISYPGFDSALDDEIIISIIARTQNPQSRCSQLKKNINVYSFALRPEDHQPSGTCNFSRLDTAKLILNASTKIDTVYALNYNVLRVSSGMAGLVYSN